jgi:hypothetical protein
MSDRRRTPRYVLGSPLVGDALPMQDVIVESLRGSRLVVISPSAPAVNEAVTVHLSTRGGLETRPATLVASHPTSMAGTVCFRLELRLDPVANDSGEMQSK